jgi:hypothetical protein
VKPNTSSGNFQKHLDLILGRDESDAKLYKLDMPGRSKYDVNRTKTSIFVIPPHESLQAELDHDAMLAKLQSCVYESSDWAPQYFSSSVVENAPPEVRRRMIPLSIYLDKVPYTTTDSFLGVFVCNLLSGMRHLSAIIRASDICPCGCRGWCSLFPIFLFLYWSLVALKLGIYPSTRHDREQFGEAWRMDLAGVALPLAGVLIYIKGDWAEFAHSLGFPTWKHNTFPCIMCRALKEQLYSFREFSSVSMPWALHDEDSYESACGECEVHISIDSPLKQRRVSAALEYSKIGKGRALTIDLPDMGLMKLDRLEPTAKLIDVGDFEKLEVPTTVLFWRGVASTCAHHRNPILSPEIGSGTNLIAIDTLHTLHLGVIKHYVTFAFWALLLANVWKVFGSIEEHIISMGVVHLRSEIFAFYERFKRQYPEKKHKLTEISNLTVKMLGTKTRKALKTKAVETKYLLFCAVSLIEKFSGTLHRARDLLDCGNSLVRYMHIVDASGYKFSVAQYQDFQMGFV